MMPMYSEPVAIARQRLEVLAADTANERERANRRIIPTERDALILLLRELHRLHLVVSKQGKSLKSWRTPPTPAKRKRGKPVGDQFRITRERGTRAKPGVSQVVTLCNERLDGKKALRK